MDYYEIFLLTDLAMKHVVLLCCREENVYKNT